MLRYLILTVLISLIIFQSCSTNNNSSSITNANLLGVWNQTDRRKIIYNPPYPIPYPINSNPTIYSDTTINFPFGKGKIEFRQNNIMIWDKINFFDDSTIIKDTFTYNIDNNYLLIRKLQTSRQDTINIISSSNSYLTLHIPLYMVIDQMGNILSEGTVWDNFIK